MSDYKTSNYQQYDADYNTLINELKKFLDIEKKIQEFKDQKEITDQDHFNSYIHSLNGIAPVEIKYPEILNILRGHEIEKAFENIYSNGLLKMIENKFTEYLNKNNNLYFNIKMKNKENNINNLYQYALSLNGNELSP